MCTVASEKGFAAAPMGFPPKQHFQMSKHFPLTSIYRFDPRPRNLLWLLVVVSCALSGCVRYRPAPLQPSETAAALEARNLESDGLRNFLQQHLDQPVKEWPLPSWDFDSLTLAAFYFHPSLAVARAQWATAHAGIGTAKERPNPTVGVGPGYNFNAASGVSPWIGNFKIDLPIETAGKRSKRAGRAGRLSDAARLNLLSTAWQLRGALRTTLIDEIVASQRKELFRQQLQTRESIFRLLQQRRDAGALATTELNLAQLSLIRTRADVADAARQAAETRSRLAEAIGVPLTAIERQDFSHALEVGINPSLPAARLRTYALQHRADILGALSNYEAAQAALQLEVARQYPDVHLGNDYQWDQGQNKWSLGVTVDLPIFNRNRGAIAEAEARRGEAGAQLIAVQARVMAEIDRSATIQSALAGQVTELRNAEAGANEQLKLVQGQLEAGAADKLDLQLARIELETSQLVRLDAEMKAVAAAGHLEDVLQMPLKLIEAAEPQTSFSKNRP